MRLLSPSLLAAGISFLACWHACHGWNGPTLRVVNKNWHGQAASEMAVALAVGGMAVFAPSPFVPPAFAESPYEEQIRQSLKPPTASKPQIVLPTSSSRSSQNVPIDQQPIIEGLLSLTNPQSEIRPAYTDTIVITVRDLSQPEMVLGGARIPVSKARFPFAFRLFPKNILNDHRGEWKELANQGDVLVKAWVCPENLPRCLEGQSRMQSQGVAKLIRNLPGMERDQTIRAPVSLPLQ